MFKEAHSKGTGYTLERFGLGRQVTFEDLKPGDFINLNRTSGSGHSVVFMGYLDRRSNVRDKYSTEIVGFKYFSAQGKGSADAGMGYRYGYFNGFCPDRNSTHGFRRDCNIIKSTNRAFLNMGRMYDPTEWDYENAVKQIRAGVRSAFEETYPGLPRDFVDSLAEVELNRELVPETETVDLFDGITTD